MGQVCAKHNEYYQDRCPWCEEPEVAEAKPAGLTGQGFSLNADNYHFWRGIQPQQQMTSRQIQDAMNKAWAQAMSNGQDPNDGHGIFE